MIQSVRINPASADGSVKAEGGILKFTFTVTPATALDGVKNLAKCLKLYANGVEVKTKAGAFDEIPVTKAEVIDKANGEVSVEADVANFLPNGKDGALSIALNVRTGVNDYTTDFVTISNIECLRGLFPVNGEGKQVRFSKGNLRYTVATKEWSFFDRQYECGPAKFEDGHDQVISLFTWGYGDWSTDPTTLTYETGTFTDWGCKIGDGKTWRTLKIEEWEYLFNEREASTVCGAEDARYAKAKVNGMEGIILLPGTYVHPSGVANLKNINEPSAQYGANDYDLSDWEKMESAEAVFFPAAGYRYDSSPKPSKTINRFGDYGRYCSSSGCKDDIGRSAWYGWLFDKDNVRSNKFLNYGCSVRLVMDVE